MGSNEVCLCRGAFAFRIFIMQPREWTAAQKGKKVRVVMRSGREFEGTLVSYDEGVNLLMDALVNSGTEEYIGRAILNGVAVAYIQSLA